MVDDHNLHIAAHLVFIVLAVMTWWPILSPLPELPRLSYPLQMMYVFVQTFSGFLVGSFITNSQRCSTRSTRMRRASGGCRRMADQQLGGLIMWVMGGFYLLLVYSAIFFAWARAEGVQRRCGGADPPNPAPHR